MKTTCHYILYLFFVTIMLVTAVGQTHAQQTVQQKIPEKTRLLFLFDASGSMLEEWGKGHQGKITIAKTILTRIVDSLKTNNKIELALRVYGHQSPREVNNCKDTKLEVPFKSKNHQLIIDKINGIRPMGVTPITFSLEQAANDFPSGAGYRNIVILITDGIESCGGDLCATSRALQKKGVFLKPYIIGLGLRSEKTLDCAGKYISAETPNEFLRQLNKAIELTFAKTTVSVELLDARGQPTETNVNVSFVNSASGLSMYDFIHYRNAQGRPDSVQVDPMVDYTLVVNTVPPVVKPNVIIQDGRHNVISIPTPQGNVVVQQEGRKDNSLQALIYQRGQFEIINTQRSNETFRYLTGNYTVETLTLPRRRFPVEVLPNKTQTVYLPAPGVANINTISTGYGSLYEILSDGTPEWVCSLDNMKPAFALTLLPGRYKVVFRVKNARGSKFTGTKTFDMGAEKTVQVNLFQ